MALTIGTRIGSYEIKSSLGEGWMGVVYRANDTKLHRDVAIKLLPDHFADDPERLSWFQREAQVLASLNHPNIAQIYGFEGSGEMPCIVMELVEGETLADRLKHGSIPLREALSMAAQITAALEAAHEKGIIHRDLKPANVKVTAGGAVKVLDFGLAKATENTTVASMSLSNSPTMVSGTTGIILGTAAYMSAEQARGHRVDRRTDIFAFGSLLFEMLAGCPAFEGDDVPGILARVIEREPEWKDLPLNTPPSIGKLLRRALNKDPRERLGDIRDARLEIEEVLAQPNSQVDAFKSTSHGRWIRQTSKLISVAAIGLLLGFMVSRRLNVQQAPPEIRLEISTPPGTDPVILDLAVSPDGRRVVR